LWWLVVRVAVQTAAAVAVQVDCLHLQPL